MRVARVATRGRMLARVRAAPAEFLALTGSLKFRIIYAKTY